MPPIVTSQNFPHPSSGACGVRPTKLFVTRRQRSTGFKVKLLEPDPYSQYTPFISSPRPSIFPAANEQRAIAQITNLPRSDASVSPAIVVLITLAILSATLGIVAMTVTRTNWYKGLFSSFGLLSFGTRPRSAQHVKEMSEEEFGCVDGVKAQLAFPATEASDEWVNEGYPDSFSIAPGIPLSHYNSLELSTRDRTVVEGDFRDPMEEEEADIALALKTALRDKLVDETENHQFPEVESQPEVESYQDNQNRRRQGSNASDSTEQTSSIEAIDMISFGCFSRSSSSSTSLGHIRNDGEDPDEADEDTSESVYEVQLARALSVEVKRGILVRCKGRKRQEEKGEVTEECSTAIPSLMITGPSLMSLATTVESSSSSMDLGEFPLPPRYLYPAVFNKLVAEMREEIYD
jgi:hypothetical protein